MPPSKYLGYSTCFIFSQIASRSRDNVSHTVSSMVLVGARRSSPGMVEVKYDCVFAPPGREEMLPVRGVRSEVPWRGSSRSSREAVKHISYLDIRWTRMLAARTIIRVYKVPFHRVVVIWAIIRGRGAGHHCRHLLYEPKGSVRYGVGICAPIGSSVLNAVLSWSLRKMWQLRDGGCDAKPGSSEFPIAFTLRYRYYIFPAEMEWTLRLFSRP